MPVDQARFKEQGTTVWLLHEFIKALSNPFKTRTDGQAEVTDVQVNS